mmetsp:Transcript_4102/g.11641  ORF Transcript_4102/g.11641 Transcript_4102/m.11641 type:complete len:176 (-) Transcript_4102:151-678(-)
MKLSICTAALLVASASAFSPSSVSRSASSTSTSTAASSSALHLFGGGNKGEGEAKGPGMMDQLAMFKKAQEVASKKAELDKELQQTDIVGLAADDKVKVTVKYIPAQLPVNPNPGYDVAAIDIDEGYLADVACEDLSEALVEGIRAAENTATQMVAEKYQQLQNDMQEMLQGMQK